MFRVPTKILKVKICVFLICTSSHSQNAAAVTIYHVERPLQL